MENGWFIMEKSIYESPIAGWFTMENPKKKDENQGYPHDLGDLHFVGKSLESALQLPRVEVAMTIKICLMS